MPLPTPGAPRSTSRQSDRVSPGGTEHSACGPCSQPARSFFFCSFTILNLQPSIQYSRSTQKAITCWC